MNIKIIEKKEKPMLSRIEINADIFYDAVTPSKDAVRNSLADSLKVDKELIVVKLIKNRFGQRNSKLIAYVYKTKEDILKIEPKKKKKEGAEAKPEEKKAEKKE